MVARLPLDHASRRPVVGGCATPLSTHHMGEHYAQECCNAFCDSHARGSLSSTLGFLSSSASIERGSDLRSSFCTKDIGTCVSCDDACFEETIEVQTVKRQPALREGRMELQGCGVDADGMDCIIQHLARTPAGAGSSRGDGETEQSSAATSPASSPEAAGDADTLRSLYLNDNDLQPTASVILARELRYNASLQFLDLSSNSIGDQGASALSAVLIANSTLETLDIASNGISHRGLDCLAVGMRHNRCLKSLELSFNGFGDAACESLRAALHQNQSIEYLGLGFNGIMCSGASSLARGLVNSRSLQRLELSYNALGDAGAAELGAVLPHTSVLQTLGLVSNGITDVGATALAEGLANNRSLMVLGLSGNHIGDAGGCAFAGVLRRNDCLRGLYLEENDIGEAGASELKLAQETTWSCKSMAADLQMAVLMGLNRRLGARCPLFALDTYICREILSMCDARHPRDVQCYPKMVDLKAPEIAL